MKGEGRYSSDSESYSPHSSDSESTCSSSSSSSSSSLSSSSRSSGYKRKRNHKRRDSDNAGGSHRVSKRRSKHTHKSKTDDHHRNVKLKRSSSSREDTTKQKTKKCTRRRVAVKSKGESSYSEDEERIYKKKRKEREKRKKNKLKKRNKGDIKQRKEVCDLDMPHQNAFGAGKSYEENRAFQALADAKEQQKAIIQHNAEVAKARLESGELQRARNEQMKMQDLYGVIDWRAKKKLRKEKRMLERTVATGKKLARLDERETARMDAFRVAVGLPTAEAQRQAEWRVRATESLAELPQGQKSVTSASRHAKVIGPCLPQS